jgi:hypothetical protein
VNFPHSWIGDPPQYLEESAFPGSVTAYQAENFTLLKVKAYVVEGPISLL